jgi:hypothetical protein
VICRQVLAGLYYTVKVWPILGLTQAWYSCLFCAGLSCFSLPIVRLATVDFSIDRWTYTVVVVVVVIVDVQSECTAANEQTNPQQHARVCSLCSAKVGTSNRSSRITRTRHSTYHTIIELQAPNN